MLTTLVEAGLTRRALEVLQHLAQGGTNQQIAEELSISVGTVKNYLSSIYSKLQVSSRSIARTDDTRKGALNHEIGHAIGLHERYFGSYSDSVADTCYGRGPTQTEYTLMDAILPLSGSTYLHCDDLTGPNNLDLQRTSDFWTTGFLQNWSWVPDGSSNKYVTFRWKDYAWAENYYRLRFYYWSPQAVA
jgi:DNA-binding CsgD family transcriptional regulator